MESKIKLFLGIWKIIVVPLIMGLVWVFAIISFFTFWMWFFEKLFNAINGG